MCTENYKNMDGVEHKSGLAGSISTFKTMWVYGWWKNRSSKNTGEYGWWK